MNSIIEKLKNHVAAGIHRIGQVDIFFNQEDHTYILCHENDVANCRRHDYGGLTQYQQAKDAREISLFSPSNNYRFSKAETTLRTGWVLILESSADLLLALDHFYPAAIGVWLAQQDGNLTTQNLREKLHRQTGMYRSAKHISDRGAHVLIEKVCGPTNQCAKKILWQIDIATPLEDSEAARFDGISSGLPRSEAVPLLCREACNHFVAQCRNISKDEHLANQRNE